MKIEAGKFYTDRMGRKVGPIFRRPQDINFPFRGREDGSGSHSYRDDVTWGVGESAFDLIKGEDEWIIGGQPCSPSELLKPEDLALDPEDLALDPAVGPTTGIKFDVEWNDIVTTPGYEPLAAILREAHDQAAKGKGIERHGNGKPFVDQPIMAIGRMCGVGFQTGQIQKKVQEATTMAGRGDNAAAIRELLGAINYSAAAILLIREL